MDATSAGPWDTWNWMWLSRICGRAGGRQRVAAGRAPPGAPTLGQLSFLAARDTLRSVRLSPGEEVSAADGGAGRERSSDPRTGPPRGTVTIGLLLWEQTPPFRG